MVVDIERIVPVARAAVARSADIYIRHTGDDLVGLILHGSAFKGDFIPGCSDIDFKLFVRDQALDARGCLPFEMTVAIQRELARVDPQPFSYIQCYAMGSHMREGWSAPVAGTYAIIAGTQPVPEASPPELAAGARRKLEELKIPPPYLADNLLEHGAGRLQRLTRLICTDVWPTLISHLIVRGVNPIAAWNLTKQQAIEATSPHDPVGKAIRDFHAALLAHYPAATSVDSGLALLTAGVDFLRTVRDS